MFWGEEEDASLANAKSAKAAEALIAGGADIHVIDERIGTLLSEEHIPLEVKEVLLKHGLDPNTSGRYSRPPLFSVKNVSELRLFVKYGADVNLKTKYSLQSPISFAKTSEIALEFIAHGADVNGKDVYGNTPIFTPRSIEIAQILIDAGADVLAVRNDGKRPPYFPNGYVVPGLKEFLKEKIHQAQNPKEGRQSSLF